MRVLTLDLATNTGWALVEDHKIISHGSVDLKPRKLENLAMKFIKFSNFLQSFTEIDLVVFEEVSGNFRRNSDITAGGLIAHLLVHCENNSIATTSVNPSTLKKFLTGKGNADKNLMMSEISKRGFEFKDNDEADAIALALYYTSK